MFWNNDNHDYILIKIERLTDKIACLENRIKMLIKLYKYHEELTKQRELKPREDKIFKELKKIKKTKISTYKDVSSLKQKEDNLYQQLLDLPKELPYIKDEYILLTSYMKCNHLTFGCYCLGDKGVGKSIKKNILGEKND